MSSCPSLVVSCPTFDVAHPRPRENCKGKKGDYLTIGKKRFGTVFEVEKIRAVWRLFFNFNFAFTRFCGTKGPEEFTSKSKGLAVAFKSDKKGNKKGAECMIACSDFTPPSGHNNSCSFLQRIQRRLFEHHPKKQHFKTFPPKTPFIFGTEVLNTCTDDVESIVLSHLQFPPVDIKVYPILSPSNFARKNLMECTNLQIVDHSFIT